MVNDTNLRKDETRDLSDHQRWTTETIGVRERVLREDALGRLLQEAGFGSVVYLPQAAPWMPFEVFARRPEL